MNEKEGKKENFSYDYMICFSASPGLQCVFIYILFITQTSPKFLFDGRSEGKVRLDVRAGHVYVTHVIARKNGNVKKQIIKLNYLEDFIATIFHISEHNATFLIPSNRQR